MDESLILIIVLAVVDFILVVLIACVCLAMYRGRNRKNKIKKFRDSSDFYLEEMSFHPYSISRSNLQINGYNTNIGQIPPPHTRQYRIYYPRPPEMEELHHVDYSHPGGQRCRHNHLRHKCPYCVQKYDELRNAHSLNDVLNENQREFETDEDDKDLEIQYRRRDEYLWRSRLSYSDMNLPRPYYQLPGLPHYVAYYGPNGTAEI